MPSVLIIDDESAILDNLQFNLELYGFTIWTANNGIEGIELFQKNMDAIDAVITDMKMPGITGLDVVKKIHSLQPDMGIIVLTGHGDMENAISSMREGAFNYLQKPFQMENLVLSLQNAIQKKNILLENKRLQEDLIQKNRYLQGLHDSAQMILMQYAPLHLPKFDSCDAAYIYKSCEKVGGDMLDVFESKDFLFFYIFDVCSHGILAAVNTIIIKAYFCKLKNYHCEMDIMSSLKNDFRDLNLELCNNTPSGIFATVFAGCIEKKTNRMYYVSAGHIDQYLIRENTLVPLPSSGTILGSFENAHYDVYQHQLLTGDKLLMFTDGLPETWERRASCQGQSFLSLLEGVKAEPVDKMIERINCEVIRASDQPPDDDLTILALSVKPYEN
ncbi:MAG: SpoIIE family protein phosphatase [Thermoclostridium sp.]|nr:SpoIIE family protein phosphatase [Thermoclostridium sp.]